MGGEGELEPKLHTVVDFELPPTLDLPGGKLTLASETGEEPVYGIEEETFVSETRIEKEGIETQKRVKRLDHLARDYYMFSLAPVYLVALMDRKNNKIKVDLLADYIAEFGKSATPDLIHYQSESPLFHGGFGVWDHLLQGINRRDPVVAQVFPKWCTQLVLVDRDVKPIQYWRVNVEQVVVRSPQIAATPVTIDLFLPTGVDRRLGARARKDGTVEFVRLPPEDWVVEEAMRYFAKVN